MTIEPLDLLKKTLYGLEIEQRKLIDTGGAEKRIKKNYPLIRAYILAISAIESHPNFKPKIKDLRVVTGTGKNEV